MFPIHDTLDAVLIGCFLFGIIFTIASLLLGFADIGLHDLGFHGAGGHDLGMHGHAAANGHGAAHGHPGAHGHGADHESPFAYINISTILAFITWFGGVGYLVRNGAGWMAPLSLAVGVLGGLVGSFAIGYLVVNVLVKDERVLDPHDYEVVGSIAHVTSTIRAGGYGEIVYEKGGTRQVSAARAAEPQLAIARGTEVIVLRVERGVAYVEPWDNLIGDDDLRNSVSPAPGVEQRPL